MKYDLTDVTPSAGFTGSQKTTGAWIDRATDAERARLVEMGFSPVRNLTVKGLTPAYINGLAATPLRDLAAAQGKVTVNGAEQWRVNPNGPAKAETMARIASELIKLRSSESHSLGQCSRHIKSWRATAAAKSGK